MVNNTMRFCSFRRLRRRRRRQVLLYYVVIWFVLFISIQTEETQAQVQVQEQVISNEGTSSSTQTAFTITSKERQEAIGDSSSSLSSSSFIKLETKSSFHVFSPRHSHATCIFKCPTVDSTTTKKRKRRKCLWLTGGYSEKYRTFDLEWSDRNADVWYSYLEDDDDDVDVDIQKSAQRSDDESKKTITWFQNKNLNGDNKDKGNQDAKYPGKVAPWYARYGHSLNVLSLSLLSNNNNREEEEVEVEVMVLTGGYSPMPSNDVWISYDGSYWEFDGYAPWAPRAYHATAIYKGELWVMGGAPLKNDVWIGRLVKLNYYNSVGSNNNKKKKKYTVVWRLQSEDSPWSPRAAACAVTQPRFTASTNEEETTTTTTTTNNNDDSDYYEEHLYLMGGFGGHFSTQNKSNNNSNKKEAEDLRARNDVWVFSKDQWTQKRVDTLNNIHNNDEQKRMMWGPRAWHGCTVFHNHKKQNVIHNTNNNNNVNITINPRVYVMGGGYIGQQGNNIVRNLETSSYLDIWYTYDGHTWKKVNHEEGQDISLYSTADIYQVENHPYLINNVVEGGSQSQSQSQRINPSLYFLGKWGFTVELFFFAQDVNQDEELVEEQRIKYCSIISNREEEGEGENYQQTTTTTQDQKSCVKQTINENQIPSILVIGGATGGFTQYNHNIDSNNNKNQNKNGSDKNSGVVEIPTTMVNDVFQSSPSSSSGGGGSLLFCELNGIICSNRGKCGPFNLGCVCDDAGLYIGEYCEKINVDYTSSASTTIVSSSFCGFYILFALLLFHL